MMADLKPHNIYKYVEPEFVSIAHLLASYSYVSPKVSPGLAITTILAVM